MNYYDAILKMYFGYLGLSINVFGNSSKNYEKITDTSLFVRKPYLRAIYIEANFEEDIDLKNQCRIKNLPHPTCIREATSKSFVDNKCNDPSIILNTAHVDFNLKNLNNVRVFKVSSFAAIPKHLTGKTYVDQAMSDGAERLSILRLDPDEKLRLDEQNYILANSTLGLPKTIIGLPKNHMLLAYMKAEEIDEIYHQCITIKTKNLTKIN